MTASVSARPSWTPLALTLGLHALLALGWYLLPGISIPRGAAPVTSEVVLVLAPSAPRATAPIAAAATPRRRAAISVPAPRQTSVTATDVSPAAAPASEAALEDAVPAALPGDLLLTAKRLVGPIERELRQGAGPISVEPERKWERSAEAVGNARRGSSTGVALESATDAEGTTVYRKTVGGRQFCTRSGSVGGLGPADGRGAGNIRCPSGLRWTRY